MNEKERQKYWDKYQQEKEKGVPFFPDLVFKDAVITLIVFLGLVGLVFFLGTPLEERANPGDTTYTPRPEWYFLFLFQMLKYFPGELEVIGAFGIPTLAILLLLVLPFLDRSPRRHFLNRPVVIGATTIVMAGVIVLTALAVLEAPPPAEATFGDITAALYTKNCAKCHGPTITVPPGTNLHAIIAQGKHEGMPAWSADLTTDQIDALAGFILSPEGSQLFVERCGVCHEAPELVAGNPFEVKNALEQGPTFPPHNGLDVPDWTKLLSREERTALLNFLVAPDGQRLFAINCAPCHGRAVAFSGEESELRSIISQGGLHLEMPPWRGALSEEELNTLARFVTNPAEIPEAKETFSRYCFSCHGEHIPAAQDVSQARQIIASGGEHETMPVWGDVLTPAQMDALVKYTMEASRGTPREVGQQMFSENCSLCHGDFGEGGPNPTRPDDVIAPISSAEYLKTRDDFTLRSIIAQGQPNFGMSPFGTAFGGPLEDDEIDAIVAFMRAWEDNPPVEVPPEVRTSTTSLTGAEIYADVCAQCHGSEGGGGVGPSLRDPEFLAQNTDQGIFDTINVGHSATAMISWGEILTQDQIQQLVDFIRNLKSPEIEPTIQPGAETPVPAPGKIPSFAADVLPIFKVKCVMCHGTLGGWGATSYEAVMTTGDNAPVVISGDVDSSLLAQKLLGTHTEGTLMPPSGKLPENEIQVILNWITAGAPDN